MAGSEEIWLPLVDEPVGNIVAQIQAEDPEIDKLVGSPHRILAFRTFAYIRVGILLGELLFEQERTPEDADETWVEATRSTTKRCTARSVRLPKRSPQIPSTRTTSRSGPTRTCASGFARLPASGLPATNRNFPLVIV